MRPLLWPTLQTALAAGISWEICVRVLDHPRPIFAPIVAIVAMGFTAGRRGRAAVLLVLGVAIGIGIGDLLVRVLGRGGIEVAVVVFVAMSVTLFLTRESLVVVPDGPAPLVSIANPTAAEVVTELVPLDGGDPVPVNLPAGTAATFSVAPGAYGLAGSDGLSVAVSLAAPGALASFVVAPPRPVAGPVVVHPD